METIKIDISYKSNVGIARPIWLIDQEELKRQQSKKLVQQHIFFLSFK